MTFAKFCPKCGTERQAKFCSKCGFAFEPAAAPSTFGETKQTDQHYIETPVTADPPVKVVKFGKLDRKGEPGGWYPDPLNADRFRKWDGSFWTDELSDENPDVKNISKRKQRVLLEGLVYGEDYDGNICCYNCGNGISGAETCALCGRAA